MKTILFLSCLLFLFSCSSVVPTKPTKENYVKLYCDTLWDNEHKRVLSISRYTADSSIVVYSSFKKMVKEPDLSLVKFPNSSFVCETGDSGRIYGIYQIDNVTLNATNKMPAYTLVGPSIRFSDGDVFIFQNEKISKSGAIVWDKTPKATMH